MMPLNALSSSGLPYRKSKYSEGVSVHSDRLQRPPVRPGCRRYSAAVLVGIQGGFVIS